eukprot:UN19076
MGRTAGATSTFTASSLSKTESTVSVAPDSSLSSGNISSDGFTTTATSSIALLHLNWPPSLGLVLHASSTKVPVASNHSVDNPSLHHSISSVP